MGAKAYRATTVEEFENALKDAIAPNIPCVIDCQIDQDERYSLWFLLIQQLVKFFQKKTLQKKDMTANIDILVFTKNTENACYAGIFL